MRDVGRTSLTVRHEGEWPVIQALEPRLMLAATAPEGAAQFRWQGETVVAAQGEWLLRIEGVDGSAQRQVSWINRKLQRAGAALKPVKYLGADGLVLARATSNAGYKALYTAASKIAGFKYLEPNRIVSIASTFPNDTNFASQWGLHNTGQTGGTPDADIDAPEAWDITVGSPQVIVAIIDTGVDYNHPDLAANIWTNPGEIPGNGIDDDGNGFVDDVRGWDFANGDNAPLDDNGHGTHVAGIIAAVTNNATGVAGVSWNAKILPLKFLKSDGNGTEADAVLAINYVTMMRNRGHNIVLSNNSWGGSGVSSALQEAIQANAGSGALFVAAAGNDGVNTDSSPFSPASLNVANIIAVAATTDTDGLASFSNYGAATVDLGAPGTNILSTINGGGYGYKSGTSMAAPFVSGVAALAYAISPPGTGYETIKNAILNGGDPVASLAGKTLTGRRLNARGTLMQLPMNVLSSVPADGQVLGPAVTQFTLTLSHPYLAASVQSNDLTVNGVPADSVQLVDGRTLQFSFNTAPPVTAQGTQTLEVAAGAITRQDGLAGVQAFSATIHVDIDTVAFPTPLVAADPLGSLVYDPLLPGYINFPGDSDEYTLNLDAGQTLTVVVQPASTLAPSISVRDPNGTLIGTSSAAAGATAILQAVPVRGSGIYRVAVSGSGGSVGAFSLRVILNGLQEAEAYGGSANNSRPTAQPLDGGLVWYAGGGGRVAVLGQSDLPAGMLPTEIEPNGSTATASDASLNFVAFSGNLYHLGLKGTISPPNDRDWFNIGTLQAGDVLTISLSGNGSARGALSDPLVELYRAGTSDLVATDDDFGPLRDSLLWRFPITVTDTYYVNARAWTNQTGTYDLGLFLENSGDPPLTGGTVTTETESNGSKGSANNVSTSWRPVQYVSTTTGTVSGGSDSDFFKFTFQAGDLVSFMVDAAAGWDAQLTLRNAAGTTIAFEDGTSIGPNEDSPLFSYIIPSGGTYYLEVLPRSGTGTYTVHAYLSTAGSPPVPQPVPDFYSIELTTGQRLTLALAHESGANLGLELQNAAGQTFASGVTGASNLNAVIDGFGAPAAGTYFVRVMGGGSVGYTLAALLEMSFDTEPNNSFASAQNISASGRVLGHAGDDWYQLAVTAGDVVQLRTFTPAGGAGQFVNNLDPLVELYNPAGGLIASDNNSAPDGRNALLTFVAQSTGNYRVRVTGAGATSGEYILQAANFTAGIGGSSGDDTILIRRNGAHVEVLHNAMGGEPTYIVPASTLTSLTVLGGAGDDSLTIDLSGGNAIPAGGLFFHGGADADELSIIGDGAASATYAPSASAMGNGTVNIGGSTITFTGLEPVTISNMASVTLITPNAADNLVIDEPAPGQRRISGTSGGVGIEALTYFNVGTLIVDMAANDGGSGNDVLVAGPAGVGAAGLSLFRVHAGTGNNTLEIQGGTATIDTGGGLGGANLNLIAGGSAQLVFNGAQSLKSLSISGSASVSMSGAAGQLLDVGALSVSGGGRLDLADHQLRITYSGPSPLAQVGGWIASGYNGGLWNGNGIRTSLASPSAGLGYLDNGSAIIVKPATYGDADLSGLVGMSDLGALLGSYGQSGHWQNGDFNYDGVIDFADLGILLAHYST
jgi:subtilisin family serine protease